MKQVRILIWCTIIIFTFCSISNAQSFDVEHKENKVILKPKFEHLSREGKKEGILNIDNDYSWSLINRIATKYLPQECLQLLAKKGGRFIITSILSTKGEFLYLEFHISSDVFNLLTDDILSAFYNAYKDVVFDMTKTTYNSEHPFDYAKLRFIAYKPIKQDAIP